MHFHVVPAALPTDCPAVFAYVKLAPFTTSLGLTAVYGEEGAPTPFHNSKAYEPISPVFGVLLTAVVCVDPSGNLNPPDVL